jgi:type II secretory pathway component PulJ
MRSNPSHWPADSAGFSLVEALLGLLLMSIILASAYPILFRSQALHERHAESTATLAEARNAANWLARAIRLAGYRANGVDEAIAVAKRDELRLTLDIDDGDPATPCTAEPSPEQLIFRLQQGRLQLRINCRGPGGWQTGNPWHEIAGNVSNSTIFRYFDENGNEIDPGNGGLTSSERTQVVSITFSLDVSPVDPTALDEAGTTARAPLTGRSMIRSRRTGL